MSRPSQSFLSETTPGFWLFSLSILYTVDGETPELLASAFVAILRSAQSSIIRLATASFVFIAPPHC